MSDMTREEVNARLETIETRMDARLSSIEQMIDTNFARFDAKLQKNNACPSAKRPAGRKSAVARTLTITS